MGRLFLVDMDDPAKGRWERCVCPQCHTTIAFLTDIFKRAVNEGGGVVFFLDANMTLADEQNMSRVRGTFTKVANVWIDDDHKHHHPNEGWTSVDVHCTKCCYILGEKYVEVESHCQALKIHAGWCLLTLGNNVNWIAAEQ